MKMVELVFCFCCCCCLFLFFFCFVFCFVLFCWCLKSKSVISKGGSPRNRHGISGKFCACGEIYCRQIEIEWHNDVVAGCSRGGQSLGDHRLPSHAEAWAECGNPGVVFHRPFR